MAVAALPVGVPAAVGAGFPVVRMPSTVVGSPRTGSIVVTMPDQRPFAVIESVETCQMFRPSTVTARISGFRRVPSHTGHGTSRMKPS